MGWLECRKPRIRIDISALLIEPRYFGVIQLQVRNQLRRLQTETAGSRRIEFGPRINDIIFQVRSSPGVFEVVGKKHGAKECDQARTDDEVDVGPGERTNAHIIRVDRRIDWFMKNRPRFRPMADLGRLRLSRTD